MLASIIISLFSIVPALVFWIFVIHCVVKRSSLLSKGIKTIGTIVDWKTHGYFKSKKIDFYYTPVVKFLDDKNEEHVFESEYRTTLGKIWTDRKFSGNKTNVIYRADNPKDCEMQTIGAIWGTIVTPLVLAVLFTMMSFISVSNLLIVDLSFDKILEISSEQIMVCIMLLVLFVGVLLLWDLFDEGPSTGSVSNFEMKEEVVVSEEQEKKAKKATKKTSTKVATKKTAKKATSKK